MAEIEHPSYYNQGGIECIDVMQKLYGKDFVSNFCLGNALKYLWRCDRKHETPINDLKKARWYIDHAVKINEPTEQENEHKEETVQPCTIEIGKVLTSYDGIIDEATKGWNEITANNFRAGASFLAKLIEKDCRAFIGNKEKGENQ